MYAKSLTVAYTRALPKSGYSSRFFSSLINSSEIVYSIVMACKIILKDEVNCKIEGPDLETRKKLEKKLKSPVIRGKVHLN